MKFPILALSLLVASTSYAETGGDKPYHSKHNYNYYHSSSDTPPSDKSFGLGIELGAPTGVTAKYWVGNGTAFDFNFGVMDRSLDLMIDLLIHGQGNRNLSPYIGMGLVGQMTDHYYWHEDHWKSNLGVRVPFGLEISPDNTSIGIFLEIAPGVFIVPDVSGFLQGDIGCRFYF